MGPITAIILGILGYKGVDELFGLGESKRQLGLGREQIASQEKMAMAQLAGSKRATRESKDATRKHMEMLLQMERTRSAESREERYEARSMQGRNQQMAMLMTAIQSLGGHSDIGGDKAGLLAALRG